MASALIPNDLLIPMQTPPSSTQFKLSRSKKPLPTQWFIREWLDSLQHMRTCLSINKKFQSPPKSSDSLTVTPSSKELSHHGSPPNEKRDYANFQFQNFEQMVSFPEFKSNLLLQIMIQAYLDHSETFIEWEPKPNSELWMSLVGLWDLRLHSHHHSVKDEMYDYKMRLWFWSCGQEVPWIHKPVCPYSSVVYNCGLGLTLVLEERQFLKLKARFPIRERSVLLYNWKMVGSVS